MGWYIALLVLMMTHKEYMATPTPLKLPGYTQKLTPYIKHWEPADFSRETLHHAHLKHVDQIHSRRRRELNALQYSLPHTLRLNFSAHDRNFRVVLQQNPTSVFAQGLEIESNRGLVNYDVSRIYTGSLEDDDNTQVYAVLTGDNLLDATIETNSEHYYLEPAARYSEALPNSGVHSIIYKVSDVEMPSGKTAAGQSSQAHCPSERIRRRKRWLSEQKSVPDSLLAESRNPPLPLDLEVPYNDDLRILTANKDENNIRFVLREADSATTRSTDRTDRSTEKYLSSIIKTHNRNILVNNYNPTNSVDNLHRENNNSYAVNDGRNLYTKHKNIIIKSYNRPEIVDPNFQDGPLRGMGVNRTPNNSNAPNTHYNSNWTLYSSNERPNPKTHVEIITKNGPARKPNNFDPEINIEPNTNNLNGLFMKNLLSGRGTEYNPELTSRLNYDRKTTCMLYLQADHTFFQKMGSEEASIEAITRHVQRANSIYKNTDFNNDGKPDNITFMIKRIKIHNMDAVKDSNYRFSGNYGVEKFLELFSEEDYDAFCLAYMFTYRDFEMGTLGLAWTGDLKNAGGVCEKNGHYRGSLKSLNTGIVTLLNYGKHVPPAVSHVTLAHEIGHNFGSPHDPEQCTPGGEDGNFIMFARATSGDKKNNNKFSTCSLKSIEPVLNTKARSSKGCFTEPQKAICGNGVVEAGEQCDCGWEEDCQDKCCYPMSRHVRPNEKPCTLTPQANCSPSQGPCCTNDCILKFADKCRDDNGCRDPSFCDGTTALCPPSINKPNKTICNKEFVCYMGDCTGSICLAYGLESCQCMPEPNEDRIKSCELCCKLPGEGNPCRSSFEWNEPPFDVPDMFSKPGTPCNDYNGYCDVFQKCREVDPSGPLATLRKLLLSEENMAVFKKWVIDNWHAVALLAIGLILLVIITAKLLSKRPNQKVKSVTIIHSATTETVRLPDNNSGVIVHTAVRTKVPFKKKVRGERKSSKSNNHTQGASKVGANRSKNSISVDNVVFGTSVDLGKCTRIKGKQNESIQTGNVVSEQKKPKKPIKPAKGIIDYSRRNHDDDDDSTIPTNPANAIGKVQQWLLDSHVSAQSIPHIEHKSKIGKVMSKSQSTPERLLQTPLQMSKSAGNLSNEKVKMQVVYKLPFRFSLHFSKKAKTKTHVVNGSRQKRPQKSVPRNSVNQNQLGKDIKNLCAEKVKRRALLLYNEKPEDSQILTQEEPKYETVKPAAASNSEGVYANANIIDISGNVDCKVRPKPTASAKVSAGIEPQNSAAIHANIYRRSLSANNPFVVAVKRSSSKSTQDGGEFTQLGRNFGSTQNLISPSHNVIKSKKRSSLNLKTNPTKSGHEAAPESSHRRSSSSNFNLRRNSDATNRIQLQRTCNVSATYTPPANVPGQHSSSVRHSRHANVGSISTGFGPHSANPSEVLRQPKNATNALPHRPAPVLRSSSEEQPMYANASGGNQLASDLEVVISDIENLVS